MMDPGDGRGFVEYPVPPFAQQTVGEARPRDAEKEASVAGSQSAADGESAVNFSPARYPGQDFPVLGNIAQDWPVDWFVEEPRAAIHQDWPMNNQFDLNIDCKFKQEESQANDVDESLCMDNVLGDDIEYESHSSDESGSDFEEEINWQKEGYTDVAELFPVADEEELFEAPVVDKAAMAREARSKAAKAKASKIRDLKLRAAAGTFDDTFVLSDSCSDDNKELMDGDDDGAVLESQIATRKYKSRAKPLKKRVYYDETKENAHEQIQLELCFNNVTQLRRVLDEYHIAYMRNFTYLKNNQDRVITHIERTYEVNLAERKCGCFKWDLTGLPCKHAVAAINKAREFPEDYVSDFFMKLMYKEAYKNSIYPVPGQHGWTKTDSPDIDPPEYKTKRGRKQKKRRKGKHESSKSSVQNRMTTMRCSNCKLQGHRYTNCTIPLKPHLAARKAQHKTVRRLPEDGAPPAPQRHSTPPLAPRRHAPHQPPHQAASNSSRESGVTGRARNTRVHI